MAQNHPNPLIVSAAAYEPPPVHHFLRRLRNILSDLPNALTSEIERLTEARNMKNGKKVRVAPLHPTTPAQPTRIAAVASAISALHSISSTPQTQVDSAQNFQIDVAIRIGYHTYTLGEKSKLRVIIRGVSRELPIHDIKNNYISQNLTALAVHRMNRFQTNRHSRSHGTRASYHKHGSYPTCVDNCTQVVSAFPIMRRGNVSDFQI
ncbi:hypothetical protein EVAR_81278_1 [Eumeta japonica]|uniref:Uncharacterized protein n=1 Tax=Eumeta variegata TaxID=151549 RepID=A0A4C1WTD7_EUMVA|nr:hypothetical protein EVAR_81278_1 [Eumeta japonica]